MEHYNKKTRESYQKYLKGKRVVLVGPAPSILDSGQGREIDKFDVVVRLNKALPVPDHLHQDMGKRTDVLYNCMNPSEECGGKISLDLLRKNKVKYLVGAYPPLERMGSTKLRLKKDLFDFFRNNRLRFHEVRFCYFDNQAYFNKLWSAMKLPNCGVMAILDLLKHDIKELYITGITFFKGGYIKDYRPYDEHGVLKRMKRYDLHQPEKQLEFMSKRLLNSRRCVLDETLKQILEDEMAGIRQLEDLSKGRQKDKHVVKEHKVEREPEPEPEFEEPAHESDIEEEPDETGYTREMIERMTSCSVVLWSAVEVAA